MSRWYPGNPWAPLGLRLSEFAVLSLCVGLSEGTSPETWWGDWLPFLAHHRVPGDSIYLGGPRPVAEYEALAASGAKWMGMVSTPACERFSLGWVWVVTPTVLCFRAMLASASARQPMAQCRTGTWTAGSRGSSRRWATSPRWGCWTRPTSVRPKSIQNIEIRKLLPLTRRVSRADGFDEMPEIYNESVYEIFGGLKKQWPKLTTMAVLDWCAPPIRSSLGPEKPNSCSWRCPCLGRHLPPICRSTSGWTNTLIMARAILT